MAEVTVTCRAWRHEHGVAPKIPERNDVPILPEMCSEDTGFGLHARQRRTRYEHALEGTRATLLVHCRAFPAVSLERNAAKTGDPERAKRFVRSPGRADLLKGHRAARYRDFAPSLRARADLRRLDVPHFHRPRNAESSLGPSGVRMLFGMELHALECERLVPHAHDLPFRGPCRDLECVRAPSRAPR